VFQLQQSNFGQNNFNIQLDISRVFFLYLSQRRWVLSSSWPHLTLLGQSLGSVLLGFNAFSLLVPDVYIDTMGYAFTFALAKFLFPHMPTGAYVHYPTISTDMLGSLDADEDKGLNAGAGKGFRGFFKKRYWHIFAWVYGWVGGYADVVVTNSSWTREHIQSLWSKSRSSKGKKNEIDILFPPVAVDELENIYVDSESEKERENILLCIAQFRPEKNHTLLLKAFANMIHDEANKSDSMISTSKLVLIGSVRDSDDAKQVYKLRLEARELKVEESVEFVCDASWADIKKWLKKSSIGVNCMWNEHFGIGVVEYQAAGLISVVNDSGGPKKDIVVAYDVGPTGFHASTAEEYSKAFQKALRLSSEEKLAMRLRAQASAKRFGEKKFSEGWVEIVEQLVDLHQPKPNKEDDTKSQMWFAGMGYLSFILYDIWKTLQQY
jgi:alpha-1,2-mannosyltransferase